MEIQHKEIAATADKDSDYGKKPNKAFGVRHLQCLLLFFGMLLAYSMRVHLSVAIVAMTATDNNNNDITFPWSIQIQSVILSSFFWGYIVLQIPAGEIASRFGGKLLVAICVGVNGFVTLLIPTAAIHGGWQVVCACRILQGLSQGFLFPSIHSLVGRWVPVEEKSRLATFIYAGAQLGTAIELMVAGFLGASSWGWPSIFYTSGAMSLVWTGIYLWIGSSSPETSKIISVEEKVYIENSLGHVTGRKKLKTPWRSIMTSLPFYSLILVHCGQNWGYWTLLTEMPSYMSNVLGVNIKSNGVLSAIPYFVMYLLSFPFGSVSDMAIARKWVTTTTARKISNTIGLWGPAIALLGLSYSPQGNVAAAVAFLIITVGLNVGQFTGYLVVHIDMAPNFAGPMMGVTNFFANIVSLIAPLTVGLILKDEKNPVEWRNVFFLASAVYFFTNLFFLLFGTSERQSWNESVVKEDNLEAQEEVKRRKKVAKANKSKVAEDKATSLEMTERNMNKYNK